MERDVADIRGLPPPSSLPTFATVTGTGSTTSKGGNPFSMGAGGPPPPSAFAPPPPMPTGATKLPDVPRPPPAAHPPAPAPPTTAQQPPSPPKASGMTMPVDMGLLAQSPLTATAEAPATAPATGDDDDEEEGPGILSWISSNPFFSKVAEKAKNSVDSMITTLDPQMKEYLYASGTVELAISSDQETIIGAVKDGAGDARAFSTVTARGLGSPGTTSLAATPLGHANAIKVSKERIANLRASGLIPSGIPVVSVEEFLFKPQPKATELHEAECLMLDDPGMELNFYVFSQSTPLSAKAAQLLKDHTPGDYSGASSGFAISVGQAVAEETGCNPGEWKEALLGYPRRQSLAAACLSLAALYKRQLPPPAPTPVDPSASS